jgi:hypothetical protein
MSVLSRLRPGIVNADGVRTAFEIVLKGGRSAILPLIVKHLHMKSSLSAVSMRLPAQMFCNSLSKIFIIGIDVSRS